MTLRRWWVQQGRGHHFWLTNCDRKGENPAMITVGGATLIKPPACLLKESLIGGRCHHGRGDNGNNDNGNNNVSNRWSRKIALVNVSCGTRS
jgi:hypothetical protein